MVLLIPSIFLDHKSFQIKMVKSGLSARSEWRGERKGGTVAVRNAHIDNKYTALFGLYGGLFNCMQA